MPVYEYSCEPCNCSWDIYKTVSECDTPADCPRCKKLMKRVYSFQRLKEFFQYSDAQYGCEISSRGQEKKLMKQHGHINARETPTHKEIMKDPVGYAQDKVEKKRKEKKELANAL